MTVERSYLISAAALLLLVFSPVRAAEQDTVQAIIPWDADGRVYQVNTRTLMFVGTFEGIMYIESSNGELNEAFVMCPIVQKFKLDTGKTDAIAHCEISASPENVAYAELSCKGEIGVCKGKFKLIDGEGGFAGISGAGSLRVRSPLRSLVTDLAAGAEIHIWSGVAVVKDLKYRIP
jgi:hypothetical protein